MFNVVPPAWVQALGTPQFDEIFHQKLLEELESRKKSIQSKIKIKTRGRRITIEVDNSKDQNTSRDIPLSIQDEYSSNLEASAGVKFIAAEAVRDAFKKTIEELRFGNLF